MSEFAGLDMLFSIPEVHTKLPAGGRFELTRDTRVDGADLQRFADAGGTIAPEGYKLFVDGPGGLPMKVLERSPRGQQMTGLGPSLAVPPGTTIVGAHPDGNGGSGTGVLVQMLPGAKSRAGLRTGSVVYRVIEVDPPPDDARPHSWKAAAVVVEKASTKQILLRTPFYGLARTRFDPDALGRVFFETPLQAIQFFLIEKRLEIESFDRRRKEAERAVAWAQSQEGVKP